VFRSNPYWRAFSTVIGAVVALVFIAAGLFKVANAGPLAEAFAAAGYPDWVRIVTGLVEVGGGVMLLRPRFTPYAPAVLLVALVAAVLVSQAEGAQTMQAGVPFVMTMPLTLLALSVWRRAADGQRWRAMLDEFAERELAVADSGRYAKVR
jgi:uncharacterized membrane protein YphA (DoxX/SURF4 family)